MSSTSPDEQDLSAIKKEMDELEGRILQAFTVVLLDRAADHRFFNCSMNAHRSST
jgi:hypothetical protein